MLKNSLKAALSVFLCVAMCVVTCTSAFAASSKQSYISDLILCSADSAEEAEAELKEQGYKLMSSENINETLSDGMYIGYKTTTDKTKAITDIAAMNMNGNYSFSDYEVLLNKMKEDVAGTVDGLIPMIKAFRQNYKDKTSISLEVYSILNKFYEEDSKQGMGDFLLNCDLEDTTDITKVFLQGYSAFIVDIQQLLFLAGENSSDKKWIEKMADSDPDELVDLYIDSYPTPNKAISALAADYGQAADDIKLTWDAFYENLAAAKKAYFKEDTEEVEIDEDVLNDSVDEAVEKSETTITENMSNEEIANSFDDLVDSGETCDSLIDVDVIEYLNSLEYNGGTMLDFFMRSSDEVEDTELYNLAYYMGDSLTTQISNVGLQQTITRVLVDGDNASSSVFDGIEKMLNGVDQISIYDGVDRTLFENGVALSSETTEKYTSSGKNWSDGLFDRVFQPTDEFKWKDYLAFYVLPTVASLICYSALFCVNQLIANSLKSVTSTTTNTVALRLTGELIHNDFAKDVTSQYVKNHFIGYLAYGKGLSARTSFAYRAVATLRCAFFILTIAMTAVSIVMLFVTIFSKDEYAEYLDIPNHIVDTVTTKNGDDYVAYNPVQDLQGSIGDLNNYKGKKGWLVLYYTKDQTVGNPLTPDMKVVKGSTDAPLDYENLTMFDQKNAANLTSKDYTGVNDPSKGTYVYFTRSTESSSAAASVISNGNTAIALAAGAVLGIIIGGFFPKGKSKKKKLAEA